MEDKKATQSSYVAPYFINIKNVSVNFKNLNITPRANALCESKFISHLDQSLYSMLQNQGSIKNFFKVMSD